MPRTPDTAAAAWRFPRCRSRRRSGRSPATTPSNIQAAIDKVSALPLDRNGFRGAVLLRAGYYRMATPVTIKPAASCCAAKAWATPARSSIGTGTGRPAAPPAPAAAPAACRSAPAGGRAAAVAAGRRWPRVVGTRSRWLRRRPADAHPDRRRAGAAPKDETKQVVTDDYVPVGARTLQGGVRARLQAGRHGDRPAHRQPGVDRRGRHERRHARRAAGGRSTSTGIASSTDVQGNTITVDAPITCAIEKRWGGGEVHQVRRSRPHRKGRRREPARDVGVRSDEADDGIRQHGPRRTTSPRSTTPTRTTTATSSSSTT